MGSTVLCVLLTSSRQEAYGSTHQSKAANLLSKILNCNTYLTLRLSFRTPQASR